MIHVNSKSFDLIVAGGGSAGSAAAIAAARRGHRVLLVEEGNCLGGVSTASGVHEWFASREGLGNIFDEVHDELSRYGARFGRFFNGEYLKVVWQRLAERASVQMLLHSSLVSAARHESTLRSIRAIACSSPIHLQARFFVDATGEGDLGFLAGAVFSQGHPESGRVLHLSLPFQLVDTGKPVVPYLPEGLPPIESEDDLPGLRTSLPTPDGRVYVNMTKVMGLDPTDPWQLSQAECEARCQLARVLHFLQRTRFPRHILISSGSRIGIREGRRIQGDQTLTEADLRNRDGNNRFAPADGTVVGTCQIDFHSLTKAGHIGWREKLEPYAIPFGCMVAKGFRNLLMAGKCISTDQVAHSSTRMTPTCVGMGQVVGTAVALAIEAGYEDIHDLKVDELRKQLVADGMELDPQRHTAFAPEISMDATRGA